MHQTIRARLTRGLVAQVYNKAVVLVVQLGAVPLFLTTWGVELYGAWLILTAISSYISLSDLGFSQATASDMTMKVARGAREEALDSFQSTWVLLVVLSFFFAIAFAVFVFLAPVTSWFGISVIDPESVVWILMLVGLQALTDMFSGLFYAGLQSVGQYGLALFVTSTLLLVRYGLLALLVLLGEGPVAAALAVAALSFVQLAVMRQTLKRAAPWLHVGFSSCRTATMRRLFGPATSFLIYSAGANILVIQGSRILVGATLGPSVVAVFVAIATMARAIGHLTSMVSHTVRPELSISFGAGNRDLSRTLHHHACQISLWMAVIALVALGSAGHWILETWTAGRVAMDAGLFYALLAAMLLSAFWNTSAMALLATNRHQGMALILLPTTLCGLALGGALLQPMGLTGMGIGLIFIEFIMILLVLRMSLSLVGGTYGHFAGAVIRPPISLLGKLFHDTK